MLGHICTRVWVILPQEPVCCFTKWILRICNLVMSCLVQRMSDMLLAPFCQKVARKKKMTYSIKFGYVLLSTTNVRHAFSPLLSESGSQKKNDILNQIYISY